MKGKSPLTSTIETVATALCLVSACAYGAVEFHVSPTGDDSASGSRERPFATVARARDAVPKLPTDLASIPGFDPLPPESAIGRPDVDETLCRWIAASSMRAVVTEAGADPTGRADSTPAIQTCIDRVSAAGGGTVFVPPGEYRILYLTLRPHVRLELAGGVERATDGWTPEVAARAMDPSRSAIIRSVANRRGRWSIFLYNLVPRTDATNGVSDVAVSGGVFDCQGRVLPAAFACGRNIRFENAVVKDIPNNHALQIDGCENVVVTNCLFAGYMFGGKQTCLTRETIQVEQTSPGAIGNPDTSPISCAREISIPNRNVSVAGCWFGPSERLGPHLIPLGHHGRARSCNGLAFAGNVVVNPLYCGVRLANVTDVRVEGNTFISTNATKRLAADSAVVCLWGGAACKPGEKGVVLRNNKMILSPQSPLRKTWVSTPRRREVSAGDEASDRIAP